MHLLGTESQLQAAMSKLVSVYGAAETVKALYNETQLQVVALGADELPAGVSEYPLPTAQQFECDRDEEAFVRLMNNANGLLRLVVGDILTAWKMIHI